MELVQGIPITDYCDRASLTAHQRLELLISVCQAVQHAHQKGVIHRDLKPSNVLITEHDGDPVVKVIDFGIAKAVNQQLTERTIYTKFQQLVGTPLYMSPEQAELSGLDIDTRSDVYSLGVLLYELLTGETPFNRERLHKAAYEEMLRIIRDEEPPKPSTRISTLGEQASNISACRGTDPRRLSQLVRGEMDWIVMKALEKNRDRRYETANEFAVDIQRFLDDEPVVACPPSRIYRIRKFAKRNKGPVAAAGLMLISLLAGIFGTTYGLMRANSSAADAQQQARAARDARDDLAKTNVELANKNAQIGQTLLHQALAVAMSGNEEKTKLSIEVAKNAGASRAQIEFLLGLMHWGNRDTARAATQLQRAVQLDPSSVAARTMLAGVFLEAGETDNWLRTNGEAMQLEPTTAEDHLFLAFTGFAFDPEMAVARIEQSLAMHDSPISRVAYALALQEKALVRQDINMARKALQELAPAEIVLGEHVLINSTRLAALNAYISMARRAGLDTTAHIVEANRCIDALLDDHRLRPPSVWMIALFHEFVEGDLKKAEAAWVRATELERGDLFRTFYGAFLLRHYGVARAVEALAPGKNASGFLLGVRLQLLALQADGRAEAAAAWSDVSRRPTPEHMLLVPLVLNDDQAIGQAKTIMQRWRQSAFLPRQKLFIDYVTGNLAQDEFLAKCPDFLADYCVAMEYLGRGNREQAREHLQNIVDSGHFKGQFFALAGGFLAQMDRDPNWPVRVSQGLTD